MKGTAGRPFSQGTPSELSAWNSLGGGHEDVNLVGSREGWDTNPNTFSADPALQYPGTPGSIGGIPENQLNRPYYPTPGQGLNNYQDTPIIGGAANSSLLLGLHSQELGVPRYHHDHVLGAGVNYNSTEDDYLNHQYYTEFNSPTPPADTPAESERGEGGSSIPRTWGSSITGGPYLGSQSSTTEQIHNFGFSDRARPGFLDSEVASQPHRAPFGTSPCFYTAQAIPIVSDKVAVAGHADPSLPPPAGMVGNRGTTHVPVELPPVGVNNPGSSRKRKRSASPDCVHEVDRTSRKKRHLAARGQTQTAQIVIPLLTRPDLYVVEQTAYKSPNTQNSWRPLPSIDFKVLEGERKLEGINLEDALNQYYSYLDGRDDFMFGDENIGNSISCRMEFVGHRVSKYKTRQIPVNNYKKNRDRITRQKLAFDIARLVKKYLEKGEPPFHVDFKDMFLVKLRHVAQASWQPELWYRRPSASS